jgi:hypothetical protein
MTGQQKPDDDAIAAWLDRHPQALGDWLDRNPGWVRRWERIQGRAISAPPGVTQMQLQGSCGCSYTWSWDTPALRHFPVRIPCASHAGELACEPPLITSPAS